MSANNRISNLVDSQVPFFVKNDHRTFVRFLELYYEYLEQNGKTLHTLKNVENYNDIDYTTNPYEEELYKQYLKLIPKKVAVDKRLLLKHVKDFYRARGTEKSIKFLLNILFGNGEDVGFYYPKSDILRASDGKWFIEKSLRTRAFEINGVSNNSLTAVQNFVSKRITGNTSGAQADVENVDIYYIQGTLVYELKVSGIQREFIDGETLFTLFDENGTTKSITANLFSGVLTSTRVTNAGSAYEVGDEIIVNGDGTGAKVVVQSVTTGNISSIGVLNGGAGFRTDTPLVILGGGGAGASAVISTVNLDETYHPNTYNIALSTIDLEAGTPIGNAIYSNLVSAISDPANNWIANSMSYFEYSNTGPIQIISISTAGQNYQTLPTIDAVSNTRIRALGTLGRMEIVDGGVDYEANDKIHFINVGRGYGLGALGNVAEVDANGSITRIEFVEVPGFLIGGEGYSQDRLPIASVVSDNGSGANIQVKAILGDGESLRAVTSSIGSIESLRIIFGGSGYSNATLNLASAGDGTAQAEATVVTGVVTYPGRWLNDDGHISSYNFLEDRDYYQEFSYVVRTRTVVPNTVGGMIISTEVTEGGDNYAIGDRVDVTGGDGYGAEVVVSSIIAEPDIDVLNGGAGFQINNYGRFDGGALIAANAIVSSVLSDGSFHPNSYNIVSSTIDLVANTTIGNTTYSNLVSSISDPANNTIANSMTYFVYANTGPIEIALLEGSVDKNTQPNPIINITSNTRVNSLGVLGRMEIIDGGEGYETDDTIHFINVIGGYGMGALAKVANVSNTGSITEVEFVQMPGFLIGGSGYAQDRLPVANVVSANVDASGADIRVTAVLGDGENLTTGVRDIGAVRTLNIINPGLSYSNIQLDLSKIGDGNAKATAEVYVVNNPDKSFNQYRKPLYDLVHPAGLKVFGEYIIEDSTDSINSAFRGSSSNNIIVFKKSTYQANLGNIIINTTSHGYSGGEEIYLEFISGDTINISNGIFVVDGIANANTLFITHSNNTVNTSGNVYTGIAS